MSDVKAGVYRHYKGPLYLLLGLAHDANADEFFSADESDRFTGGLFPDGREVIVYIALELTDAHTGPRLAVRTHDDFFAWVHRDGTLCENRLYDVGGKVTCTQRGQDIMQRFTYLGPTWEGYT